jgi:hypothetical protein
MTDRTLHVSTFRHARDNVVVQHETTWQAFTEQLTKFRELDASGLDQAQLDELKERQPAWSPVKYKPGTVRSNPGVEWVDLLVLDLDDKPWEPVREALEPYEYLVHTTFSHSDRSPRYRVVLPLLRPVPADRWNQTWLDASTKFLNTADDSCKDPARIYFVPCHRIGYDHFSDRHQGKWLDPDELTKLDTPHQPAHDDKEFHAKLDSLSNIRDRWLANARVEGRRHQTMVACLTALLRLATRNVDVKADLKWLRRQYVAAVGSKRDAETEFDNALADQLNFVLNERLKADPQDGTKPGAGDATDQLLRLAERDYDFVVSQEGEVFAVRKGTSVALPLRDDFPPTLSHNFRRETGKYAKGKHVDDVLRTLTGDAHQRDRRPIYRRCAAFLAERKVLLDLGDVTGRTVEVDRHGWRILDCSPVLFTRNAATLALPEPGTPDLTQLRQLVNVNDDDYQLLLVWLVHSYFGKPTPILFPEATQGSGKTQLARVVKAVLDPSKADLTSPPTSEDEWVTTVTNQHVVNVDDVTRVPEWWAGALKRTVTGAGQLRRKLYTTNTVSVYRYINPLVLTAVGLEKLPADLVQRTLPLNLLPIDEHNRRSQEFLDNHLQAQLPAILAGLLELTARVLAQLDDTEHGLDRMADFCRTAAAFDRVNGTTTLADYKNTVANAQRNIVNADEFGRLLLEWCHRNVDDTPVELTAGEVLNEIQQLVEKRKLIVSPAFPKTPERVASKLTGLEVGLANEGFLVQRTPRTATKRLFRFQRKPNDGVTVVTVPPHFLSLDFETKEATATTERDTDDE